MQTQQHLNRSGPVPIYHQVAMSIEQRIASGEWRIGTRLPSERELAELYGTSRMTMRQALTVLEESGVVVRKRPGGTYVALQPQKLAPTLSIPVSFVKTLIMAGHNTTLETLGTSICTVPTMEVARHLDMPIDGQVVQIERLVRVEGTPTARVCSLVPEHLCPGLDSIQLVDDSIHATMRSRYGIHVTDADHWIESGLARPPITESLEVESGSAVLLLVSRYCDETARPVEYVTTYWRADIMKLHLRSRIESNPSTDGIVAPDSSADATEVSEVQWR